MQRNERLCASRVGMASKRSYEQLMNKQCSLALLNRDMRPIDVTGKAAGERGTAGECYPPAVRVTVLFF